MRGKQDHHRPSWGVRLVTSGFVATFVPSGKEKCEKEGPSIGRD